MTDKQKTILQQLAAEEKPIEINTWGQYKKNLFGLSDKKENNKQ